MNSEYNNQGRYGISLHVLERGGSQRKFQNSDVTIAEIGKEIFFDPSILDTYHYDGWKPVHYDLLVVCAAVEFADRSCPRRTTQWSRPFDVTVPVRELEIWKQPEVLARLLDTLHHLTGDDWRFSFVQAGDAAVNGTGQRSLPFGKSKQFVIAYSDGIDSRCVSGLYGAGDSIVRVRVKKNKDHVMEGELPFDLIPFDIKNGRRRESSDRSRGFKFAAITAIAGHLSGVSRIIVPESGQGALGPVLLPLHNIYADYRNHPTFFRKMERFIKVLFGCTVIYEQPRLWSTKGQTISAFLAHSGNGRATVLDTRSCWQRQWNVHFSNGKISQCGLCAACLLRRMSIHAAGLIEPSNTYTISDLTLSSYEEAANRESVTDTMVEHGSVGTRHFQQLANMAELPDEALRPHVFEIARATSAPEQDTHDKLRTLLVQHAKEWREFVSAQGQHSFLNRWMIGGRYGRSE